MKHANLLSLSLISTPNHHRKWGLWVTAVVLVVAVVVVVVVVKVVVRIQGNNNGEMR